MYTVMGATGKVGASVAQHLLARGDAVVIPLRDPAKAQSLISQGAQPVLADYERADQLAAAMRRAPGGAFVMLPPLFDPSRGFPEARAQIDVLVDALNVARPAKVVALSTVGANAPQANLLNQLRLLEERLSTLPLPVVFLRAAWFLDNAAFDVAAARSGGQIDSYLQPLDRALPMVAAADVGAVAADLLAETWQGLRVVEVEGPVRVSPLDIAAAMSVALGRPVHATSKPRSTWATTFVRQGMRNPEPRMQTLDGFNEGWICFTVGGAHTRRGTTTLQQVIARLAAGGSG